MTRPVHDGGSAPGPPRPSEVAGLSLAIPRLRYEVPAASWGSASLARPHLARALDGAALVVRPPEGSESSGEATFELPPFLSPAVQPYLPPPAAAWRALLVDQRLLARPELIWTGTLPEGWNEGLPPSWAEEIAGALQALHRRYRESTEERMASYGLRSLECAECRTARVAKVPPELPPWQRQMRLQPSSRCPHVAPAIQALDALCRAHPELTFELLGWLEPAGARAAAEGPEPTHFALAGPLLSALIGPWLVGERPRLADRTIFRGWAWSTPFDRRSWGRPPDPARPLLPREQRGAVALATEAWGLAGEPEALVTGDATAAPPGLDLSAAPSIEAPAALPGGRPPRRKR